MSINYKLFARLMNRASEVAKQGGIPPIVTRVHNERLKAPAEAFLSACAALDKAVGNRAKEGGEAGDALERIDKPYAVARATALAYLPHLVLPETLKSVATDTDKMVAIETLIEVLEARVSEAWAKELLDGAFGKQAPSVVKEIDDAIQADAALAEARAARAEAYGLAYDEYLSFKRVVRAACGPTSREYHRIHLRSVEPGKPEEE